MNTLNSTETVNPIVEPIEDKTEEISPIVETANSNTEESVTPIVEPVQELKEARPARKVYPPLTPKQKAITVLKILGMMSATLAFVIFCTPVSDAAYKFLFGFFGFIVFGIATAVGIKYLSDYLKQRYDLSKR